MWRSHVSIRYRIMALVMAVVIGALAAYLLLAISLFKSDKLAYVYDLNGTAAKTIAEEIESATLSMGERLFDFSTSIPSGRAAQSPRAALVTDRTLEREARRVFGRHADVLQVEVWEAAPGSTYQRVFRWYDPLRLAALDIEPELVERARLATPPPWNSIAAERLALYNTSLPPDLALLSIGVLAADEHYIVIAHIRPERLLRMISGSSIYTASLVDREGSVLVHPEPALVVNHASLLHVPIVKEALAKQSQRGVRPFVNALGEEFIGAYARIHSLSSSVVLTVPTSEALAGARRLIQKSILFAIGIILLCVLASIFYSRQLTAPLRRLEEATRVLSAGNFDVSVTASGHDEVGRLAAAFNRMAQELRDREARLEEAHQQLLQSSKLAIVGEMAAGISHEVKNPMVGMRGFAQLGQRAATLDEAREYFALIEKETGRATAILENLLRFARKGVATHAPLSVNDLVSDAIRLVRHQLQTANVQLEVTFADDLPPVPGDANQLQQVMLNLIINAEHAMASKAGKEKAVLRLGTQRTAAGACIMVEDNGIGMTAEVKAKLFRAFHTTKATGTGLGLSVSQRIINEHMGRIEVESETGRGTTFRIFLPAAVNEDEGIACSPPDSATDNAWVSTPSSH